jgi:hypothetical protein
MLNKKSKWLILSVVSFGVIVFFYYYTGEKKQILKRYDPKNKVTHIFEYKIEDGDTILHGKSTKYNENGKLIAEGNFVNGQTYGKWHYYYDNGNIEAIHFRTKNEANAESIWNYPDGKVERYVLFDEYKNPVFLVRYDKQGGVKSYEGLPLIETYQFKIARKEKFKTDFIQYLKVGDTLKYKYLIANLPNAKRDFRIELLGSSNSNIKRKIEINPPSVLNVAEVVTKKGINSIKAIVKYKFDDIEKTIICDTITFDVEVH